MRNCTPGFNSERKDPVSGVTHLGNGYRAFNPVLTRFASPDGWSPFGPGGINRYAYCAGDPVNRADPSGHHSLTGWLGIGVGVALGLLLTPVSGGSSLAVALSAASVTMAIASAGLAVAQQFVDASDPVTASALGWAALGTGIVSGLSSAALSWVAPGAKSLVSLLKGPASRPIGGLMMSEGDVPTAGGQFRHPRFLGVYSDPVVTPGSGHMLTFCFQDNPGGHARLNIVGQAARKLNGTFTVGSGVWMAERYAPRHMGFFRIAGIINEEMAKFPEVRSVRLLVPQTGGVLTTGMTTFYNLVKGTLTRDFGRAVLVTAPKGWFDMAGGAVNALRELQDSLTISENAQMVVLSGQRFSPDVAQGYLEGIAHRYGDVTGAFRVVGGHWVSR